MGEKTNRDLKAAVREVEKRFGKGALFLMDEAHKKSLAEAVIPTGSFALDQAVGGGYPKGRVTEIYGPEAAGKTTLALHAIAETQKMGGRAAFIDAEHALDIKYAASLGVRIDELLVAQPDSGEQGLAILEALAKTGEIDLAVIDSVAALVPQVELNGEMSDQTIGAHARLMSKALRVLIGTIKKSGMAVLFINQIREKIGVMFGNPETTTGGRALRFYASLRLEIRKEGLIKDGDANIGLKSRVTAVKNKLAAPFETAHINIYFGKGFDYSSELIDFAAQVGVIEKSGSWYAFNGKNIGQGVKQVREFLGTNSEMYDQIKSQTLVKMAAELPACPETGEE